MSKSYISCETLDDWFANYDDDQKDWIVAEIIENLCQGLADCNILLVDTTDKDESDKLRNINNSIISALRDLKKLRNEVAEIIANGDVLVQNGKRKP